MSMTKKQRNLLIAALVIVAVILLDQWVKALAVAHLRGQMGYAYLDNFIRIEYAENRGAFLSLGAGLSDQARLWIFVFGVVLILGSLLAATYALFR